jgi:type I restriction enzyme, S subunit
MSADIVEIGDFVDVVSGPAFKSSRFTNDPSDVPLIKGENVAQGYIAWDKSKFWPAAEAEEYERFALKSGDIVLRTRRKSVERPAVRSCRHFCVCLKYLKSGGA